MILRNNLLSFKITRYVFYRKTDEIYSVRYVIVLKQ